MIKNCPYEEIGCKFQHKKSKLCWFADNCKAKLCPFIHKENSSASICNNLTTQQATIVEDDLVYCDFCEQKFSSESKVKQHIKVSHKEVANDVLLNAYWERDDQVIYSFECGNCSYETSSEKNENLYIEVCQKLNSKCDKCNFKCTTAGLLEIHRSVKH